MNKETFLKIIAGALEVEVDSISMESQLGDVAEWDSLGQLSILSALSDETNGASDNIDGIANLDKLSEIFAAIESKG